MSVNDGKVKKPGRRAASRYVHTQSYSRISGYKGERIYASNAFLRGGVVVLCVVFIAVGLYFIIF